MKKFFAYELKKSLFVMCALAVIASAVYVINVIYEAKYVIDNGYSRFSLNSIMIAGAAIAIIVPIWKLSYRMKKRSVDLYYALPLSHTRILVVKVLVGLIAVLAPYTIAYWIGSFTAMGIAGKELVNVLFLPLYFVTLMPIAMMYFLTAFAFARANRFVDGLAFVAFAGGLLATISCVVASFVPYDKLYINSYYYAPFGPFWAIENYFSRVILGAESGDMILNAQDIVGLVLFGVISVAAGVGLFFTEKFAKAENCEQISDSLFGYKTMIPLYGFSLAFLAGVESLLVLVALTAAAVYAASVLYKRTPKIGWKFAAVISVATIVGFALSFIPAAYL